MVVDVADHVRRVDFLILSDRDVVDALPSLESERRGRYRHPQQKGRAQFRPGLRGRAVAGSYRMIEVRSSLWWQQTATSNPS